MSGVIGLWFRATDDVTTRQVLWEEGGRGRGLSIYVDQGFVYVNGWNLLNDDMSATTPWGPRFVRTAINPNTFYHVALVFDQPAGEIRGLLDGTPFGKATAIGKLFAHPGDVNIGRVGDATVFHDGDTSANHFFKGLVDEVELYNRALTASEIQAIFNAGSSGEVKPTPYGQNIETHHFPGIYGLPLDHASA
ncbi:MAG: LamG domain-containing protein [Candidatus Tectomicrobia bacterium]|nr:LamG domain-containing protein [Candidatus Tectomicrobia bacterium]